MLIFNERTNCLFIQILLLAQMLFGLVLAGEYEMLKAILISHPSSHSFLHMSRTSAQSPINFEKNELFFEFASISQDYLSRFTDRLSRCHQSFHIS